MERSNLTGANRENREKKSGKKLFLSRKSGAWNSDGAKLLT